MFYGLESIYFTFGIRKKWEYWKLIETWFLYYLINLDGNLEILDLLI